jgi:hypothetical protein
VALLVSCLAYSLTLKTEATLSSETSVDFQQTSWQYIHNPRCANLRSHITLLVCIALVCLVASSDCEAVHYVPVVAVSRRLPSAAARIQSQSRHLGFVVDKVALGQVSSEYFSIPCQFSFHRLHDIQHHPSTGAGTVGKIVADIPSELSLTPS